MIREHDRIILTSDFAGEGLKIGDVGTVVHVHQHGEAFEVEFVALNGETVAVATVPRSHVRQVSRMDMSHARQRVAG